MNDKVDVLIVDDLKENHLVMEGVLDDPGLNIVKAMSGEEALALCMTHDFAVIFMDVQMPEMDGFETAELLRGIEKTKHIPIIFVTALSKEKASVFKGYEVGAIDFLSKPIDPIVLRSKARVFKEMYQQKRIIELQAQELQEQVAEMTKLIDEKQELESISMQDSLTGIYNRRGTMKLLTGHWRNCIRYGLPMSVLLFDLDRFKGYNDNYGHVKGDEVLYEVAKAAENALYRAEDFVGRYGGEEFIVIMPNTNLEGAMMVARRVNDAILDLKLKHDYNGDFGQVTVSIGVASCYPELKQDVTPLIDGADKAMYLAKNNGRNQIRHTIL